MQLIAMGLVAILMQCRLRCLMLSISIMLEQLPEIHQQPSQVILA